MTSLLLALLLTQTPPKTWAKPGSDAPYVQSIQGVTGMTPLAISGTITSSGAGDTVGASATYNANSVCGFVATAGQAGAGFFVAAGTLAATLTPSVSTDSTNGTNGTWTATSFVDIAGNTSATLVLTNPNSAAAYGLKSMAGQRYAKVCTTAYTSGSAAGNLVASTPQPPPPAAGADVTDRSGRLVGVVSAASLPLPTGASTAAKQPALGTAGSASADVLSVQGVASMTALKTDGSGVTQPVSGTVAATESGTWTVQPGNTANTTAWKVDGSAVTQPVSGTVSAAESGTWNITNVSGTVSLPTGAATAAKQPALGTAGTASADVLSVQGITSMTPLKTDGSGVTQPVSGTVTANAGTGTFNIQANASTNVAQINGVTALMGNGVTGTGSQRVTIASDNTAFTVKPSDGTNTVTVKAASTAPATTDTALVVTESPQVADQCPNTLAISQTTSTDILTTTNKLHLCSLVLVASAALVVNLIEGTGTVCASGPPAALIGSTTAANGLSLAANGGFSAIAGRPWLKSKTTADHICLTMSGTGTVAGTMTYADQ